MRGGRGGRGRSTGELFLFPLPPEEGEQKRRGREGGEQNRGERSQAGVERNGGKIQ